MGYGAGQHLLDEDEANSPHNLYVPAHTGYLYVGYRIVPLPGGLLCSVFGLRKFAMSNWNAGIEKIMITERLYRRRPRPSDGRAEHRVLAKLTRDLARDPRQVPQKLVDAALNLCDAGTAAISRLHRRSQADYLYWMAVAGHYAAQAAHIPIVAPRDFSACGVVLDTHSPQLFHCPGRYLTYLNGLGAPIVELLVVPIHANNQPMGTIWVARHDPDERPFDAGDLRVLVSLAGFAAATLQLMDEPPTVSVRPEHGAAHAASRREAARQPTGFQQGL